MTQEPGAVERVRLTAEARFKLKQERKTDAEKVWIEIAAGQKAGIANTARLRALRLAKEDAERAAAASAPKAAKPVRKKRVAAPSRAARPL